MASASWIRTHTYQRVTGSSAVPGDRQFSAERCAPSGPRSGASGSAVGKLFTMAITAMTATIALLGLADQNDVEGRASVIYFSWNHDGAGACRCDGTASAKSWMRLLESAEL